ncbi:ATPase [Halobaculum sp. CBA1158]|uniref:ATPase n=1 Tax=Halobaculum sp. CBA1158 TaxID=2904243 RepID=UPI001F26BE2A|nr:ATPase [Halobaculum sp. CBA1158]UIO98789.1 ATPase [Halobaculum sp. CBA1158]
MRLLVAGADAVDAGKTTFAVGLAARLRATGSPLAAFKPRAGNDYWFDHDDVRRAAGEGRLYGKDVDRLLRAEAPDADRDGAHERRNPIHRLWRPTPGTTGLLGEDGRTFLVDRVTTRDGDEWVVNATAELPEGLRSDLALSDARRVDSVAALNDAMRELHVPALDRLAGDVRTAGEDGAALVESYGEVTTPLRDVRFDAVAAVDPGRCRIYGGDRWAVARETATGGREAGRLEVRVDRVTDMLDPVSTHDLRPLSAAERADPDAVASAYREAYDALVTAARGR